MGKINLLNSKVFNRISAGEVVERPYSVVKELVENSIDANAKNITVKIENGGISSIKVIDDGNGIEFDDLRKALLPHATSKISCIKDLDNILTLGFRGEALASIASVSRITIISKPITQQNAAKIHCEGGEIFSTEEAMGENGTEITVNNLFFNTPVREKFLKTVRSEESEITSTISRFILGNPNISFKYYVDNKLILQSYGDGEESAFLSVYDIKTLQNCYCIDTEKNGIKITGYIGKPSFAKANRSHQTLFLNGRYIVNSTISSAIANAYVSYLMKRQYPFYVLNISLPTELVDVNVHPNKIDVRFANNQIIYGSIYSVVSKVLDGNKEALNIIIENNSENTNKFDTNYATHNIKKSFENSVLEEAKRYETIIFADSGNKKDKEKYIEDIFAQNKAYLESLEKKVDVETANIKINTPIQDVISIERDLTYIGQALNSFLIFEDGVDLFLIDQHAAHERVLFDKFIEQVKNSTIEIQPLLIDYLLNVNEEEYLYLSTKLDFLKNMGFEIVDFGGNTFKISSVPVILDGLNIQKFFDEFLSELNTLKNITIDSILAEKIAQKACKSAIKAGDNLSKSEVDELLKLMKGNLGLKCPHGRPIAIKITRAEIDKWFKRII